MKNCPKIIIEPFWKEWEEDGEQYSGTFYRLTIGEISEEHDRLKYAFQSIEDILSLYKKREQNEKVDS